MTSLAQTLPVRRLQALLSGKVRGIDVRAAARAAGADDLHRTVLGGQWGARTRLETLCALSAAADGSELPAREREAVQAELGRIALRILWSEGFLGDALTAQAPPVQAASRLLELAASELLPNGPAFRAVMHRARMLLRRHDMVALLSVDAETRAQLLGQLERAESRVRLVAS